MQEVICNTLKKAYPQATIALTNWKTPWELLVCTILAAQCTDVRVNSVTAALFRKYRTLEDYIHAPPGSLEQDIKSTGFFNAKAKNIRAAARVVKEQFHGQVPKTMEELLRLPGVARKTANVVLGNAYGITAGIVVDTHMIRLSQRLRLVPIDAIGGKKPRTFVRGEETVVDFKPDADPVKIERALMDVLPRSEWLQCAHVIVAHGRTLCKAKNPACSTCVVRQYCPASRVVV